ncbi:MAG: hypothetical protein K6F57_00835 [Candidatus Saccharibacteria bacterium]|nr:hypothetical protein [Candidatus Saccharibacteria bacterium]
MEQEPTQKRKIKFQNRVKGRRSSKKGIRTKINKQQNEELQVKDNLQEEFDKKESIKLWLSVIAIGIGIIGMIATTVPKYTRTDKRIIKYNLSCLTGRTRKPLKNAR